MLKKLHIRNYALIEHLEIQPVNGLNVITGETGAGKSILLGAVGLLLGNRADTSVLFDQNSKCIIEGIFGIRAYHLQKFFEESELDYEEDTIIRREINPAGKSRAFINDTPVTLDIMRMLGARLMDIHSQHDSLLLGRSNFQFTLLDNYAGCMSAREKFETTYTELKKAEKALDRLRKEKEGLEKEADYQQFILEELINAKLESGEQDELEKEVRLLEHAEEIRNNLNQASQLLSEGELPALESMRSARSLLSSIRNYGDNYSSLHDRLESCLIELNDLVIEIQRSGDDVEFDPEKAEQIQDRLSNLYSLQKKHHVTSVEELVEIREKLDQEALHYHDLDDEIDKTAERAEFLRKESFSLAATLTRKRTMGIPSLEKEMTALLQQVGISEAVFKIRISQGDLNSHGQNTIELLFSANKGIAPQALAKVASGGEFSRLMFCIKRILAEKVSLPTIIFDEIDTGVSGGIALKMGEMMKFMAKSHQIISISHLPQMAARADRHYFVYKESGSNTSVSRIRELSTQERVEEIAKMIGGEKPSENARESARELINLT